MEKRTVGQATAALKLAEGKSGNRSAMRDKMDIHRGLKVITKTGTCLADVRLYVTRSRGAYGYQFAAAVWLRALDDLGPYALFGERTGGCGYSKEGTAVDRALGLAGFPRALNCQDWNAVEPAILDVLGELGHDTSDVLCVDFHA